MGVLDNRAAKPEMPPLIDDRKLVAIYRLFERENDEFVSDIQALRRKADRLFRRLTEINDYLEKLIDGENPLKVEEAAAEAANVAVRYARFVKTLI